MQSTKISNEVTANMTPSRSKHEFKEFLKVAAFTFPCWVGTSRRKIRLVNHP
jgi:hypothetical protein